MKDTGHKLLIGIALAFAVAVGMHWSWNTVVPVFGGPTLEFHQAVAGMFLLVIAGAVLRPRNGPNHRKWLRRRET